MCAGTPALTPSRDTCGRHTTSVPVSPLANTTTLAPALAPPPLPRPRLCPVPRLHLLSVRPRPHLLPLSHLYVLTATLTLPPHPLTHPSNPLTHPPHSPLTLSPQPADGLLPFTPPPPPPHPHPSPLGLSHDACLTHSHSPPFSST